MQTLDISAHNTVVLDCMICTVCAVMSLVYGSTYCNFWYMTRYFTITASGLICVLPLCYPKRIDFLKYAR